jgi:uracil-DNA glycosylase family 4
MPQEQLQALPILQPVSTVAGCLLCPMAEKFPQSLFVPPQIGDTDVLVVGNFPREQEVLEGIPSTSKWLESLLRKAGLRKDEVTIVNTVQCEPPKNVYPSDLGAAFYILPNDGRKSVEQCMQNHVWPLVRGRKWRKIIALGEEALFELTGKQGIFNWRGSPLALKGTDQPIVIPTLHPDDIGANQKMIPIVINDLKKNPIVPPEFYNLTPSLEDVRAFDATDFASDIECNIATQAITMVGFSSKPFHAIVVPFQGAYIPEIKRIYANAKRIFLQNGLQFDQPLLANNGIHLAPECEILDTMLLHHLCFPDLPHDLELIASMFTNKPAWKAGFKGTPGYWELRNARDTDVTLQAGRTLVALTKQERLWDLYCYVQIPLAKICRLMYDTGFKVDPKRLQEVRERLILQIAEEELKLPTSLRAYDKPKKKRVKAPSGTVSEKTGNPVKFTWIEVTDHVTPWRSPKVVEKYLYTELGLPPQLHPKSRKVTSDKGAIEKCIRILRRQNRPELAGLLAYQKVKKAATLLSGFVTEDMVKQSLTRMNSHFNVQGTSSGRLSSSDPNLQNQPPVARYMYIPSHAGWSIIDCDYSNIEPRLTAYFANDQDRLARFMVPGYNEHKWTASQFFDIPIEDVVKSNENDSPYLTAKRINNGLNYGMGIQKLCNTHSLDYQLVKDCVFKWKQINHQTAAWQLDTSKVAEQQGFLTTPFGRKRWFWTSTLYTESLSFLPQSSGADILFKAMIGLCYDRIDWPLDKALKVCPSAESLPRPARLLLSVHDSLVFECPNDKIDEAVAVIRRVMEAPIAELGGLRIPVEVKVGPSWAETEVYPPPAAFQLAA